MAKAAGTDPGILPLPNGGGAQRAIDETFQTNLSTGTGFYEIPLSLPRGVNDLTPSLALKYSTGAGNGPFGIGWSLNLPSITRRTERGIPQFSANGVAGDDRDVFHLEGQELAPVGGGRYRTLLENESSLIRRVAADNSWELRLKNGTLMRFGTAADARSGDSDQVLEWHLTEIRDVHDNVVTLTYTRDGSRAYLATVSYAVYRLDFQYEARPDAFSSYRAGIELRTARRCLSIDLFLLGAAESPVKSYRISYTQAPFSLASLLTQVQLIALEEPDGGGAAIELPLPPVTLEYTTFDPGARRMEVFDSDGGPPPPLTGPDLTLLDFEGTGRPGVIEIRDGTARFWSNNGLRWGAPRTLPHLPLNADLGDDSLRFIDMEGNGTADLLVGTLQASGFFPNTPGGGWGAKVSYRQSPNVPLASGSVRLLDVDGDNRVDLLHADSYAFYHYLNRGEDGWAPYPIVIRRRHALDEWPDVDLASPNVRFADVVGDGRSHLVVIHSGRCVYYPNLGFGNWGAARPMTNAPRLPRHYDPARLFLADIDGDGTADVIYVDFDCVRLWFNQSGAAFSDEVTVHGTPPVANAAILIADMRGNGTNGVLWSYAPALRQSQNYRYLNLTGGVKPLLLRRITSNTRVETTITYGSSTDWPRDTTDPELANQASFLPFPVQVVRRLEMHDPTTGVTSASDFSYRNGNYDGKERVFLGFGRAERIDAGDATIAANRTVTYFHNQDVLHKGLPRLSLAYGDDGTPFAGRPFLEERQEYAVTLLHTTADGTRIQRVAREATTTRNYEREVEFNEVRSEFEYDTLGNVTLERRLSRWTDDQGIAHEDELVTEREYAVNEVAGLHGFVAREFVRGNGELLRGTQVFYDGAAFDGLPSGQVQRGNRSRERQFVMTVAVADAVYGAGTDLTAFGYAREVDPVFGDAYFVDTLRQRFDARGNLAERRNGLGHQTSLAYDDFGIYPARITFANGLKLEAEYEYRYGSMTLFRDAMGVEQRFGFDGAGRITATWRFDDPDDKPYLEYQHLDDGPLSRQITLTRTEAGAANQQRRVEYFDGLGQTLQIRASAENGAVVVSGRKMFNAKGLVQREYQSYISNSFDFSLDDQQPANTFTEYYYDARGRSTRRMDWNGEVFETRYQRGRRTFFTPLDRKNLPGNLSFDTPRTEWLDAQERVVAVVERKQGESYVTRYAFDSLGSRLEVRFNDSLFLTNTFDGQGRRIRSAYRDAGVYTYLYDAAGNLIQRTDGKGDIVARAYDAVGRITELRHGGPAGTVQEAYVYDTGDPGEENTAGNLISVSGPFGTVRYRYGKCGCYESKTRSYPGLAGDLTVLYDTDSLRRYSTVTYPNGFEQEITYNEGGLIDSIAGVIDKMRYGPTGKRTRVEFSSGVVTDYEYDPASLRLTRLKTTAPDGVTTYQDLTYEHDEIGAITAILDGASAAGHIQNNRTFSYDALEQILRSTGTDANGAFDHGYEYDRWGNITRYPEQFQDDHLLYEDAARPFQITGMENQPANPYSYDGAGNLTQSLHNSYEYDARNRLVKVTRDDGTVSEYLYDHAGSRVKTTVTAGGVTESLYNFDDIYTVANGTATRFVFDDRGQVALIRDDGSGVVFHADHLGSQAAESDLATGALLHEESYYAFGMTALGTAFESPYGFAGKKWSEGDGLVFFGGRYYLPEIGRFLTPDPYFLEEQAEKFFSAPRGLQLYTYVLNNPINMIDPYGTFFGLDDLIVAAVGFVVGAGAYTINWAISGGDFQWSEFFASGLFGAAALWFTYSTVGVGAAIFVGAATLAKPAVTGGLDKAAMGDSFGHRLVGLLSFAIKFGSSPVTSTVGLLIGGFGTGFGLWGDVEWFKGGVIAFEYDDSASGFAATTLGATVNIWQGDTGDADFAHELYHSRQYTYFGDAFVPMWIVGGVYGLISSAIAGEFAWGCFYSASPTSSSGSGGGYGNPLESGAHSLEPGGGCT
jgi:RHS repeat-associated protein